MGKEIQRCPKPQRIEISAVQNSWGNFFPITDWKKAPALTRIRRKTYSKMYLLCPGPTTKTFRQSPEYSWWKQSYTSPGHFLNILLIFYLLTSRTARTFSFTGWKNSWNILKVNIAALSWTSWKQMSCSFLCTASWPKLRLGNFSSPVVNIYLSYPGQLGGNFLALTWTSILKHKFDQLWFI